MISSFISSYSLNTLFTETNSSWLIYESIKTLEIKTYVLFKLVFVNNIILPCFFSFFLNIDSYIFIPAVIDRTCIPNAELVIFVSIPTKEAKAKIEIHQVTAEAKIRKCSI